MLIKRLSFEEQGRHYGYPECCISNFFDDKTNLKVHQEKYHFVYGYLPCSKCINSFSLKREDVLNYYDSISQSKIFLTALELLMKKHS